MNYELKNNSHPFPQMVAVAILVVDDGDETSVVRHSCEKEVVPCGWDMRTDGDFCRHGWTQSAQSGDDKVAIRGMIIIAGTLSVAHQPLSVFLVKVFPYVGPPTTIPVSYTHLTLPTILLV